MATRLSAQQSINSQRVAERLRKAREASRKTQADATAELQRMLPYAESIAQGTVSRYEMTSNGIGHKDPLIVIALATIYHAPVASIDPAALTFLRSLEQLVERVRLAGLDRPSEMIPTEYDQFMSGVDLTFAGQTTDRYFEMPAA